MRAGWLSLVLAVAGCDGGDAGQTESGAAEGEAAVNTGAVASAGAAATGTAVNDSSAVPTMRPLLPVVNLPDLDPHAVCRNAYACTYDGRCAVAKAQEGEPAGAGDRRCVATDDAMCAASRSCRDWGACHAKDGGCVPASDEHCRAAWICRTKGFCSFEKGRCRAVSTADCKRSELCRHQRKCDARNGRCVR